MHHSPTYLSREHMNLQLTCSQRQWLHSSVGRASHRYREVTGSNPVEVLNFFQASFHNCEDQPSLDFISAVHMIISIAFNCVHNCEDQPSLDFISAVHMIISYTSLTFFTFTGTYEPTGTYELTCSQRQWLHSSVGRASHRYREVTGSNPVEVLNFFQASLRNCI